MSRLRSPLSPEVRALLDRERVLPAVPAPARARALTRARAALVAGRMMPFRRSRRGRRMRWGVAVAIACIATVAVAATAYQIGAHRSSVPSDRPSAPLVQGTASLPVAPPLAVAPSSPAAPPMVVAPPSPAAPPMAVVPPSPAAPVARAQRSSQAEPDPDELRLLRQARAAVARQDFAAALIPIAAHARRFKNGRLAEEREALRVRALSGLGRTEEARHASDSFEARFPRSVLLPAVRQMPAPEP
jgi:hypothetical protein